MGRAWGEANNFMRKILSYIITVILLCGVTVSCSKKDDNKPKGTEETILMFFPYSGLEDDIAKNIVCMKNAVVDRGGLDNKRIIVCKALSSTAYSVFEMKYTEEEGVKKCIEQPINSNLQISFNISSSENETQHQARVVTNLQQILQMVKVNAPALSYSMIIGCHGSAWLPSGQTLNSLLDGSWSSKAFGTANDRGQIDNLSLVKALNNENIHLRFLLFDACYMGNVETAYDYRNVCDYYLASPNEIMDYGVPYDYVGDAILNNDYESIVEGYAYFYKLYTAAPWGTFAAVDCSKLDALAKLMKELNTSCLPADANIKNVQIMDGFQLLAANVFFDLKDYVDQCCTNEAKKAEFANLMKLAVPYARHTDAFFCYWNRPQYVNINTFCGLSTVQPTKNPTALKTITTTAWWQDTH